MQISFVTTTGITTGFRHWPEAVQARDLLARGHQMTAVTYFEEGSRLIGRQRERIDGVEIARVRFDRFWRAPGLAQALDEFKPQVVHLFHLRNALNHAATTWAKHNGVPVVFTVVGPFHDPYLVDDRERPYAGAVHYERLIYTPGQLLRTLLRERKPQRAWQNYLMHRPLLEADRVIALSQHEVGILQKMGVREERIRLVPLWIDQEFINDLVRQDEANGQFDLEIPQDKAVVLFIGQLKIRKGYDLLAKAMPLVLQRCPQTCFVFAGQNPAQAGELRSIADGNNSAHGMLLLGQVSEEQKVGLLRRAACLVYPTRYESFGLPPLEAMVVGTPVVSTDLPVVSEMIEHESNGLLAKPEDPASLAENIVRLLESPQLRAEISRAGRFVATARYNSEALMLRQEQVYQELVGAKNIES